MSKTPKTPYGCAACPREYGNTAGFGVRVVNEQRQRVCPVCKARIDARKEKTL